MASGIGKSPFGTEAAVASRASGISAPARRSSSSRRAACSITLIGRSLAGTTDYHGVRKNGRERGQQTSQSTGEQVCIVAAFSQYPFVRQQCHHSQDRSL